MPTFKEFQFRQGLNLILADKSPGATERQTRNGAGKSSLTELIHFLMGVNLDKPSLFRVPALSQYSFGIVFDLGQTRTQVERSADASSKVIIRGANAESWLIELTKDKLFASESEVIPNSQWRVMLVNLMFGLKEGDEGTQASKFGPTFRSLFSYFVRRQSAGGFTSPIKNSIQQQTWDEQVAKS